MNYQTTRLTPGLYFAATPIGAARDITLRALDLLASADVLAAEDTRSLRHLMEIHGIPLGQRPLIAYHDHSGPQVRARLLDEIAAGKSVVYAPEAGTALVADPGYQLARAALEAGHKVTAAPGPSALLAALGVAGLPSDKFLFAGFLPNAKGARRKALQDLAGIEATLVFYESPKRVAAMLADAAEVLGPARQAAICRELTKKFEEVRRGTLGDLAADTGSLTAKGEFAVLIGRPEGGEAGAADVDAQLAEALRSMSLRDAAEAVAAATGVPKRKVYQRALELSREAGA